MNSISIYTHGEITYYGTNIGCKGETLRLANSKLNSGMIRQVHLLIELRSYDLMVIDNKVIDPVTQTALGSPKDEFSISGTRPFVWSYSPAKCQLMSIMSIEMETGNGSMISQNSN